MFYSSLDPGSAVPALDFKCSSEGCWYCKGLCHCCMCPVSLQDGKVIRLESDKILYFCKEECRQLVCPEPGAPPVVSATYHEMKPGKVIGPAKLQILKSMKSEGDIFSRLEFIELCVNTSPGTNEDVPLGRPYVLWQVRTGSQQFLDFLINDDFEPLQSIWSSQSSELNVSLQEEAVKMQLHRLLQNILQIVLSKIGFTSVHSFVMSYASPTLDK